MEEVDTEMEEIDQGGKGSRQKDGRSRQGDREIDKERGKGTRRWGRSQGEVGNNQMRKADNKRKEKIDKMGSK